MPGADWPNLIAQALATPRQFVNAETFLRSWHSYSRPAAFSCDDGHVYVIKGRAGIERSMIAESVIGAMGALVSAPVPPTALVMVPEVLRTGHPDLAATLPAGRPSHGSREVPGCSDRLGVDHTAVPDNRLRFAALHVLYSWAGCFSDHQLIYENAPPHLVYSVDHGHFLPQGPNWSEASLNAGPPPVPDPWFNTCNLLSPELRVSVNMLRAVTPAAIAAAVARPPDEWGFGLSERCSMAEYLHLRQQGLQAHWAGL